MITVPRMASLLRKVFEQDARALAREMGVIKRERKVNGATLVLLLVLGWLHQPQAGPSALARFAGSLGVTISKQGIEDHWTYSTTIRLPDGLERYWRGCRGGNGQAKGTKAGVKLTVRLDLSEGTLYGPLLQDGRSHESTSLLQQVPMVKGALWIADLGYFALVRLAQLSKAGVYFLMPLKDGVVTWLAGKRVDVLELLSSHGPEEEQEYAIILGAGKQVPCRLFARRATAMQIKRRHEAQDEYARKHGTQVTQRQRDWAEWTLVISNVPACLLSLAEALVLLRMRWQIELVWKLWKMQGQVDEWQTENMARILCEVYAKLLGVLLQHWLMLLSCWDDPHRSTIGVSEMVRDQVVVLAHGFCGRLSLTLALRLVCEAIGQAAGRSIVQRADRPSASRLLLACDDGLT